MQLKHILISIFFLVFSITLVAQDDKQADYASVIKQADDYFNAGDYINAKTSYQYATRLKPADDYAKTQLQKTIDKLRERMMVMEQYSAVIAEADDFFRKAEYEMARSKYQEAAKIVPSEGYPAEKIKQIEEKEGQHQKKQEQLYETKKAEYEKEQEEKRLLEQENKAFEKAISLFEGLDEMEQDVILDQVEQRLSNMEKVRFGIARKASLAHKERAYAYHFKSVFIENSFDLTI